MNQILRFTDVRIKALQLTCTSSGILAKDIAQSVQNCIPISMSVLREALIIESRSVGSRTGVCNILRREIYRQELLEKVAA